MNTGIISWFARASVRYWHDDQLHLTTVFEKFIPDFDYSFTFSSMKVRR